MYTITFPFPFNSETPFARFTTLTEAQTEARRIRSENPDASPIAVFFTSRGTYIRYSTH